MEGEAPKLIVCGTGPMEEWCREFIRQNQLHAELKGFVSNAEVRRLIAESRALILPTQWYEGFPMSIVEAYSVGTPVLGGIYMPGTEKESGNLIPEDSHFLYGGTKSLLKKPVV